MIEMKYEIVIGLEVHAELSTKSKIYCSCTTEFGGEPNTHCCPICTGMPGTLPVLNKNVVEYAIKAGLATNCQISGFSKQDRKNYFYPDLPKAYQISQYDLPVCKNGYIDIEFDDQHKRIGLTRIHIEEDAGKLFHDEMDAGSLIDYNRCGVPLIEIVSEPDMRSSMEAKIFLEKLKAILEYIDVSDCKMQEGSLRADVNVSVRPFGQRKFGTRTEMKNLNSFKAIIRAIEGESRRQIELIESGTKIIQETRRWDDNKGVSYSMRSKEEAHDYRYFPEPDLVPIVIDEGWIEEVRNLLPELPHERKKRYTIEFLLPEYDASVLTSSKHLADYFEQVTAICCNPKLASNWIMGELMRILKAKELEFSEIPISAEYLAKLLILIDKGKVNGTTAKKIFGIILETGKDPELIVSEQGLEAVCDEGAIVMIVNRVIEANNKSVLDYMNGKDKALGFIVGQCMKESKGKADAKVINRILKEQLEKLTDNS